VERRLAAILATDMVGFSRLMERDEAGTIERQKAHRKELIDPQIARHGGRIVKTTGDGMLVEFNSVTAAAECAVAIQRGMGEREAAVDEDRRIRYRVGINTGDIVIDDGDIYGDGVNIAARLEALAEPGGICVPRKVCHELRNKLDVGFEFLGEKSVKNIAQPIAVYRVLLDPSAAGTVVGEARRGRVDRRWSAAAAVAMAALVAAVLWWQPWSPDDAAEPGLPHRATPPDRPSVAVLPLDNVSGDPGEEYFSDGMTVDLITDLSKISGLFVVSRNAVFRYKDKQVSPAVVGAELGIRYVLEGSVRKAEGRMRINLQLVDASTGFQIWADRFDRGLEDMFAVQDEVAQAVAKSLQVQLTEGEGRRVAQRPTRNLEAYDYYLRGQALYLRYRPETNLDPAFAAAHLALARTYIVDWDLQFNAVPDALDKGVATAQAAVNIDPALPESHLRLGWAYMWKKRYDEAIAAGERAIELDPDYAEGHAFLGEMLNFAGRPDAARREIETAMHLDPYHPFFYPYILGHALDLLGEKEAAIAEMKRALAANPNFTPPLRHLAVVYSELGRIDEARAVVEQILRINPGATVSGWRDRLPYKDAKIVERFIDGWREAGLPE
jgi:TolB-like protein/class 3 adenylate cyclase